ncbi:MAG: adenylyl-sulfate kinase [Microbacteriaceae bacterium]
MGIPRVVVCGAVDDGKSTLIGRLLAETGSVPTDEIAAAIAENGTADYSRLTDGLESEREQGITIDVAYRYLRLPNGKRALLADSPGHEQYTRNMAVAASLANTAVLVIDTTRGIRRQTLRHAKVCRLMGVRNFVVALNKVDALGNQRGERITELIVELREAFDINGSELRVNYVEVSGLFGENVTTGSQTLLDAISEATTIQDDRAGIDLRLPIQRVIRAQGRRWYAGRLASGSVHTGDTVQIWPSGAHACVVEVLVGETPVDEAIVGESIAVEFDREIDAGRGDVLVPGVPTSELPVSRAHLTELVWLDAKALQPHTSYLLRTGPHVVPARVEEVRFALDLDSGDQQSASTLEMNDIGRVEITTDQPLLLDRYAHSRDTGGFILCDRLTGQTVAAGMSIHPLQRTSEVSRHQFTVTRAERERHNGVQAGVFWLTGLPGSGKSSIADEVEKLLFERGIRSYVLDGDAIRQTLSEDLGFDAEDRRENVRRVARVAQMMIDAGLVVLVSLVSPIRADREAARELFAETDFMEIWVNTPLDVCQQRDPKGLYARAQQMGIRNMMTGLGQPYEEPTLPWLVLDGTSPVRENAHHIVKHILNRRLPSR